MVLVSRTLLTADHHKKRIERIDEQLNEQGIETFLVLNSKNIFYLTGLSFIPTERPIILILHEGDVNFFVPSLEIDHVEHQVPFVSQIFSYFEYPDEKHPMFHLADNLMRDLKIQPNKVACKRSITFCHLTPSAVSGPVQSIQVNQSPISPANIHLQVVSRSGVATRRILQYMEDVQVSV